MAVHVVAGSLSSEVLMEGGLHLVITLVVPVTIGVNT